MFGKQQQKEPFPREELPPHEGPSLDAGPYAPEGFDKRPQKLGVVNYPHPALRAENKLVTEFDGRLKQLVFNLFETMYAVGDGIGLAAPQVGVNLRLMVYNPQLSDKTQETVFVNPKIVAFSSSKDRKEEFCMSFPRMSGTVERPIWIEVEAVDWTGTPFSRRIEGFEARLFQHEYDHLDGIVFPDRMTANGKLKVQGSLNFLVSDYKRNYDMEPAL